jgi:hypothetical protein
MIADLESALERMNGNIILTLLVDVNVGCPYLINRRIQYVPKH